MKNQQRYPMPRPDLKPLEIGVIRPETVGGITYRAIERRYDLLRRDAEPLGQVILQADHVRAVWSGVIMLASTLLLIGAVCWLKQLCE